MNRGVLPLKTLEVLVEGTFDRLQPEMPRMSTVRAAASHGWTTARG
jgi:hypothetical protein